MPYPCLTPDELESYASGRATGNVAEPIERHLAQCRSCSEKLQLIRSGQGVGQRVSHQGPAQGGNHSVPSEPTGSAVQPAATAGHPQSETATLPPNSSASFEGETCEYSFLAPAQEPDEIGRLGPYRILKVLGTGGMGMVFLAQDPVLKRPLALKVMRPGMAMSSVSRERFLREARTAATVEHDHVVHIYQVGEDRGVPYLAMQFLRGETLEDRLRRHGHTPLPIPEILRIGRETAEGLAAAHDCGLVHRDIKPGNIFLESARNELEDTSSRLGQSDVRRGRVKILDFGVARAAADAGSITQPGAVIGTPAYMAPEQASGRVEPRSDLFSLGSVLYRLSTGRQPFYGTDTLSTLMAVATETPPDPCTLNPEVSEDLSNLVMQLLAKRPGDRPASARAVVQALAALERGDPLPAVVKKARQDKPGSKLAAVIVLLAVAAVAYWSARSIYHLARDRQERQAGPLQPLPPEPVAPAGPAPPPPLPPLLASVRELPEMTRLIGHTGLVHAVEFSPDRQKLLSGGADGTVRLWDLALGKQIMDFRKPRDIVWRAVFSPDGRQVLAGGGDRIVNGKRIHTDYHLRLWDVAGDQPVRELEGHTNEIWDVAFSPDSKEVLSTSKDGTMRLWNVATGKMIRRFEAHKRNWCVAFSPNGHEAVSGGVEAVVHVWNVATGKEVRTLAGHEGPIRSVAYSPDGRQVLSGSIDKTMRLWDVESGQLLAEFPRQLTGFSCVRFSPDGHQALSCTGLRQAPAGGWESAGFDFRVRIWDVAAQTEIAGYSWQERFIPVATFSRDGKIVACASNGGIIHVLRLRD
jgi:WD40 repeat protein/serine/threonine protein kinase